MTSPESPDYRPSIPDLLKKCEELCGSVGSASKGLPANQESFLRGSLGDALQQLELILRVLDGESRTASREESQGLLRRIFARKDSGADAEPGLPNIGASRQGLQGNSWTISLSELLGFLAFGRKTGVLWVDTLEENYMLVLEEGRLLHATSDQTPAGLRLGETLVGFGFLTRRQLTRFLANRKSTSKVIAGEDLIVTGMISEEELLSALTYQVQQLFFRLICTQNAVFRFREGMEIMLAHKVSLDINQLLLQTAAAQDENEAGAGSSAALDLWDNWDAGENRPPAGPGKGAASAAEGSPASEASSASTPPAAEPRGQAGERSAPNGTSGDAPGAATETRSGKNLNSSPEPGASAEGGSRSGGADSPKRRGRKPNRKG